MNKENAKDYLPLVQALAEGKTIQFLNSNAQWEDCLCPSFAQMVVHYRIKPEQLENKLAIADHLEHIALKIRNGDASTHNLSESIYQRSGSFICEMKFTYECKTSKPEPKKGWYRVLLVKNNVGRFYTTTADSELSEKEWLKDSRFIEWLTDRIECTLPEGDA